MTNKNAHKTINISLLVFLILIIVALYLQPVQAEEYDNAQINDSLSSSTSSMSNYQINNDSETRHRVGDVECAAPSAELGLAGRRSLDSNSMAYVAFNVPFGGSTCKSAQKTRLKKMEYDLHVAKIEQHKKNIIFQEKMASVCSKLHEVVTINPDNILFQECAHFSPTHGHPARVYSDLSQPAPH